MMFKKNIRKLATALTVASLIPLIYLTLDLDKLDQNNLINNFKHYNTSASKQLAIIEIDDASIEHMYNWPWPRKVYGELIDKLAASEPKMVVFDIDFSSNSNPFDDSVFTTALSNATFPVILPTVITSSQTLNEQVLYSESIPIDLFAQHVELANANAHPETSGLVFNYATYADNGRISIGAYLANLVDTLSEEVIIDYSIDPKTIPSYSFKDILSGNFDKNQLKNKKILIGSTSITLGDMYTLPKYGRNAGVYIHALGFESMIKQDRLTKISKPWILLISSLLLFVLTVVLYRKKFNHIMLISGFLALIVYLTNLALHHLSQVIMPPSYLYVAILISIIWQTIIVLQYRARVMFKEQNDNKYNQAVIDQMIKSNSSGIIITNEKGQILVFNDKAKQLFCLSEQCVADKELVFDYVEGSQQMFDHIQQSTGVGKLKTEFGKQVFTHHDGTQCHVELSLNKSIFNQEFSNNKNMKTNEIYNFTITDISEKMQIIAEKNKSQLALIDLENNDPLTKLPNRKSFNNYVEQIYNDANSDQTSLIILVNLNSIKEINEIYGQLTGDDAICQVGRELNELIGVRGHVTRFSNKVFGIIINNIASHKHAQHLKYIQEIYHLFTKPTNLDGQQILMSISMGIAIAKFHGDSAEKLITNASQALDHAKNTKSIDWFFYEEDLANKLREKRQLEIEIKRAIKNEEFVLYYQPQHDIKSGDLVGYESLIRWEDPEKGLRFPDDFIPAAEEFDLITEIGELVLKLGCSDAAKWPTHLSVAINVSPAQFIHADMAALCRKYLTESGLSPNRLELEVTESMMMDDIDTVIKTLSAVKKLGVKIAMDDFGTGYSSLQYMTELPFDKIKIDRSFTMNIGKSETADNLMKSIIAMGHSLNKIVLAEGVEEPEMIELLKASNCEIGQGYYYGKPMSIEHVHKQLGI